MTYCRLLVRSMADRSGKADGITYVTRAIRRTRSHCSNSRSQPAKHVQSEVSMLSPITFASWLFSITLTD
jgi:hypothetical protein